MVLSAIEDTLKDQNHGFTPTAYFAALLALLSQALPPTSGIVNKELATSVVYLLDLVTPFVPPPLLRSKFSHILTNLAPALDHQHVEAALLRSAMGCLEALLVVQDAAAWALSPTTASPRRAVTGLLTIAVDHRPKVRKRAQDALTQVLCHPPPSPSLDHPAADLCAETAIRSISAIAQTSGKKHRGPGSSSDDHHPGLVHALQLTKTIASASGGWPSKKIETLCETLLPIARSSNEYLTISTFSIFEAIFTGIARSPSSSAKLPRLLDAIAELRPSQNDSQLLPPWIAILSRGYDVSAQLSPGPTFLQLPALVHSIAAFLASPSSNIRISAAECLLSFTATCIPPAVILHPSDPDLAALAQICHTATKFLSVTYQAAWRDVFRVLAALFAALRWRAAGLLDDVVRTIGELRGSDAFAGKAEADALLGTAVAAIGPEAVLALLPLNLPRPAPGQPGRVWLLPILREHVANTNLLHFRTVFVPLSHAILRIVVDETHDAGGDGGAEKPKPKTMEIKIFETLVQQIWALLPGYCTFPLDVVAAFDRSLAEQVSSILYTQVDFRPDVCRALQLLVETNQVVVDGPADDDDDDDDDGSTKEERLLRRITAAEARRNLDHLASFAGNLLAVLFNVYGQTLPHHRGYILQCINAYLSITPEKVGSSST